MNAKKKTTPKETEVVADGVAEVKSALGYMIDHYSDLPSNKVNKRIVAHLNELVGLIGLN